MASRSQTVLLRGGPGDGSTLSAVPEDDQRLDYHGTAYVRTKDEAPRPGDTRSTVHPLPVFVPA